MKPFSLLLMLSSFLLLTSCARPAGHDGQDANEDGHDEGPAQALYHEVMDIHDEVMPKMDELEKLKRQLGEQIANSPDMMLERKQQLTQIISNLDSAGASMMDWMAEFNPLPDSASEEDQREYLESEMERIKKVRDLVNESLAKARETKEN